MIFVTVGTTKYKFKRLIDASINFARRRPLVRFVVQSGTYKYKGEIPSNVTIEQYFPFLTVQQYLKECKLVICHAGMGTILQAYIYGKKPLVIPRLARFREHANDHETAIANHLSKKKLIFLDKNLNQLNQYLIASQKLPKISQVNRKRLINKLNKLNN